MKYLTMLVLSLIFFLFPQQLLAQTGKVKDANYYYEYVQKRKIETLMRVKLKNGMKVKGRLNKVEPDHFEMKDGNTPYTINYADIAEISASHSVLKKIRFAATLPIKVAVVPVAVPVLYVSYFILSL